MRPDDLVLVRSDLGDGGWSLHHPDTEELLLSGEAEYLDSGWSRPNSDDYRAARLAAEWGANQ